MVYKVGIKTNTAQMASFGKKEAPKKGQCENRDVLMYEEKKKHPVSTGVKIQADKLKKAFTTYPVKGLKGSKNANFYEFLTMGTVPYLVGSAGLIASFNAATPFFTDEAAKKAATKLGNKMALGVLAYGLLKNFSKKLVEVPVNMKYGIDVNLPYKKKIDELPDGQKDGNLVAYEYHKAAESVDFTRWDLFYDNPAFGDERTSYFKNVGKKLGLSDEELEQSADQKVKPLIKEKLVKTKLFSTLSSYLWAGTGVAVAMQDAWDGITLNPIKIAKSFKNSSEVIAKSKASGLTAVKNNWFKDFGGRFCKAVGQFVNNPSKATKIAGRSLLLAAVGMTVLGNLATLVDFNKNRRGNSSASTSIIDDSKGKVEC